jgi:hypothetical protein
MKTYLFTTGMIFGLLAVGHLLRLLKAAGSLAADPGFSISYAVIVVFCGSLSYWAWRLYQRQGKGG